MTTKEKILEEIKDINYAYNDCSKYNTIKNLLDEMEEERKKGKWVRSGEGSYQVYECSSCGKPWLSWWASCGDSKWMSQKLKFCPNCGADMRGDQNESN